MTWLDPLRAALDDRDAPARVVIRDDDAGWADDRLWALLEVIERAGALVDVAVIPSEVSTGLARGLTERMEAGVARVHQHGLRHVSHATLGRKCEFGDSRSVWELSCDVREGRRLLARHFARVDAVFTPPWNRCSPDLGPVLVSAGYRVLSRDVSAGVLGVPGLDERPVTVDWFGHHKGVRWTRAELGRRLAVSVREASVTGLMLHHAISTDEDLDDLHAVLRLMARHPQVLLTHLADEIAA